MAVHSEKVIDPMKTIILAPPVKIALRSLDAENARKVHAWFDHLKNWDRDAFVRGRSHSLASLPGIYVLMTHTDLRIFFRLEGSTITVLDISTKQSILMSAHSPRTE
jgi:hypothetical protein